MALELREDPAGETFALAPEFIAQRGAGGSVGVNPRNPVYPIVIACALDALGAANGRFADAAAMLGVTSTQLRRLLGRDQYLGEMGIQRLVAIAVANNDVVAVVPAVVLNGSNDAAIGSGDRGAIRGGDIYPAVVSAEVSKDRAVGGPLHRAGGSGRRS